MNEVFYSLSLAVACAALWFNTRINPQLAVLIWLCGTWLILGGLKKLQEEASNSSGIHSATDSQAAPRNGAGTFTFAPIHNPTLAHFVTHLKPSMTLLEIEAHLISYLAHGDRQELATKASQNAA